MDFVDDETVSGNPNIPVVGNMLPCVTPPDPLRQSRRQPIWPALLSSCTVPSKPGPPQQLFPRLPPWFVAGPDSSLRALGLGADR